MPISLCFTGGISNDAPKTFNMNLDLEPKVTERLFKNNYTTTRFSFIANNFSF